MAQDGMQFIIKMSNKNKAPNSFLNYSSLIKCNKLGATYVLLKAQLHKVSKDGSHVPPPQDSYSIKWGQRKKKILIQGTTKPRRNPPSPYNLRQ